MPYSLRQQRLLEVINQRGGCSVEELAREFRVSDMTIRRDLAALAEQGRVVRTHGGAAPTERVSFEFRFLERAGQRRRAKEQIGRAAAELVSDGDSVMLDSGTTTLALARALRSRRELRDVTIVTTSLPVASELQFCDGIRVLLLGGYLRRETPDLVGPVTESNLEKLRADLAFIGADALDERGRSYNNEPALARMLGQMANAARRAYCVADSSKLGRSALAMVGDVSKWSGLITDDNATAAQLRNLRRRGVNVMIARASAQAVRKAG